jgi:hypothetical protein
MQLDALRKWVRNVYATQDEELDCDGLYIALPQFVDLQVAGEDATERFPDVKLHLQQCAECYDLYHTVRDAALLEHQQIASKLIVE